MDRPRIRFSLLTAVLLMTIVGLAIVVARLWIEVGPLRNEIGRLRTEQGLLVIDDESVVHAIQLPELGHRDLWKYRVYVPDGMECRAVLVVNGIPFSGLPAVRRPLPRTALAQTADAMIADLMEGEHLLTVGIVTDVSGVRRIAFERYGPDADRRPWMLVPKREEWPIRESGNTVSVESVPTTTLAAHGEDEMVLIRYRRESQAFHAEDLDSFGPYDDGTLADGFILWIERISDAVETPE